MKRAVPLRKAKANMSEAKLRVVEPNNDSSAEQTTGSVDKIRDILFGTQIKTYEARFSRLEESIARDLAEMKDAAARRFDTLESFVKKETETLGSRLKAERQERTEQLRDIARDLKTSSEALAKKILDLDNKTAEDQSGLRQDLMKESHKLLDDIRQKSDSLTALLERRSTELRELKLDRTAFAAMLNELALQISEEPAEVRKPSKAAQ